MGSEQVEVLSPTSSGTAELDQAVVDEGLASLAANRDRPYYDAAADADATLDMVTSVVFLSCQKRTAEILYCYEAI